MHDISLNFIGIFLTYVALNIGVYTLNRVYNWSILMSFPLFAAFIQS